MLNWAVPDGLCPKESSGPQSPSILTPLLFSGGRIRMWLMRWRMRKGRSGNVPSCPFRLNIAANLCWWNRLSSDSAYCHMAGSLGALSNPSLGGPLLCVTEVFYTKTLVTVCKAERCWRGIWIPCLGTAVTSPGSNGSQIDSALVYCGNLIVDSCGLVITLLS